MWTLKNRKRGRPDAELRPVETEVEENDLRLETTEMDQRVINMLTRHPDIAEILYNKDDVALRKAGLSPLYINTITKQFASGKFPESPELFAQSLHDTVQNTRASKVERRWREREGIS